MSITATPSSSFWRDRCVLVTGASGFLGTWIVDALLLAGARVTALTRKAPSGNDGSRSERLRVVRGDVRDARTVKRALAEFDVNTVFHLAAQALVGLAKTDPIGTLTTNVGGTWSVLEACRTTPSVKYVVVASSDKAYGGSAVPPFTEESPTAARFPYDASKACADLLAQMYQATFGLPVVITRCGNFFGGGDLNFNRIVPGTLRSVLSGQRPVIRSDGRFVRDYLYIEDAVIAYLSLVECLAGRQEIAGEAFNFSNEVRVSVLDLVARIVRMMGSDLEPLVLNEVNHEIRESFLSAEKARRLLGWAPRFTLDEGLERTIAWYRGHEGLTSRSQ